MAKEIAKQTNTELATNGDIVGMEDFADVAQGSSVPRIQICQAMSDTAKEAGIPEGHFYNNFEFVDLGDSLQFVVLKRFLSRSYLKKGEGLVCRSDDSYTCSYSKINDTQVGQNCGQCPYSKWDEATKTPPPCSLVINYVIVQPENPVPAVFSCMKTALSAARKFDRVLQMSTFRYKTISGGLYELKTKKVKNDQGTFYVPEFLPKGPADIEVVKAAIAMRKTFEQASLNIHEEETGEF